MSPSTIERQILEHYANGAVVQHLAYDFKLDTRVIMKLVRREIKLGFEMRPEVIAGIIYLWHKKGWKADEIAQLYWINPNEVYTVVRNESEACTQMKQILDWESEAPPLSPIGKAV